jgi:hypothetical protein
MARRQSQRGELIRVTPTVSVRRYSAQDIALARALATGNRVQITEGPFVWTLMAERRQWSPGGDTARYEMSLTEASGGAFG